jgi:serine acetyltransferase
MKRALKGIAFALAVVLAGPLILLARLEARLFGADCERVFDSCKELLAIVPTPLGDYLRQAFYWGACRHVHPFTRIAFGAILAHRDVEIAKGVVIGSFSIIGCARIGPNVLVAPQVSVLSGKYQHGRPQEREGHRHAELTLDPVSIGAGSFLGQGALILADVGTGATVGAGSVVNRAVPDGATVMGNPARKVSLEGPA